MLVLVHVVRPQAHRPASIGLVSLMVKSAFAEDTAIRGKVW